MILATLASLALAAPACGDRADSLDEALAFIPPGAKVIGVIPDLRRANQDLSELLDAMDRPATVLAGRPIEMLKAQLGIGVELDESGSVITWFQLHAGDSGDPIPVFLLPTKDSDAFLRGNFTREESAGPDAWRTSEDELLYARKVMGHVLLSPNADIVTGYDPDGGAAQVLRARLGSKASAHASRGDLVIWVDGDVLRTFLGVAANDAPGFGAVNPDPEQLKVLAEGATDGLLVVDFDPLGLSIRTFIKYDPMSTIGSLLKGSAASTMPMNRLPGAPFYFAASADVAGMGGLDAFRDLIVVLGLSEESLPAPLRSDGIEIDQIQIAAYPSRLGIALGGLLNDSSLVMTSRDPKAVEEAVRSAIIATAGERGGIRYEPTWTEDKPLRTGGSADAFQVKETVLPPEKDGPADGIGDAALMRVFMQLLYGSRGLSGFIGTEGDSVVMTFSQRPDVWSRALAAAGRDGATLADGAMLKSMRSWLIEKPDFELLLGVGTFGKLAAQLARTVPMIDPSMMPSIPEGLPPVAFDLDIDKGSIETATVIPTGIIALVYDQVMEQMLSGFEAPRQEDDQPR